MVVMLDGVDIDVDGDWRMTLAVICGDPASILWRMCILKVKNRNRQNIFLGGNFYVGKKIPPTWSKSVISHHKYFS